MKNTLQTWLRLSVILCLTLIFVNVQSCKKDDDNEDELECRVGLPCTLELRSVFVSIKDTDDNPVLLDYHKVIDIKNNREQRIDRVSGDEQGVYFLAMDGDVPVGEQSEFQFKGYINNQEVVSSSYEVWMCCHVEIVSGDNTLVIQ